MKINPQLRSPLFFPGTDSVVDGDNTVQPHKLEGGGKVPAPPIDLYLSPPEYSSPACL